MIIDYSDDDNDDDGDDDDDDIKYTKQLLSVMTHSTNTRSSCHKEK